MEKDNLMETFLRALCKSDGCTYQPRRPRSHSVSTLQKNWKRLPSPKDKIKVLTISITFLFIFILDELISYNASVKNLKASETQ